MNSDSPINDAIARLSNFTNEALDKQRQLACKIESVCSQTVNTPPSDPSAAQKPDQSDMLKALEACIERLETLTDEQTRLMCSVQL